MKLINYLGIFLLVCVTVLLFSLLFAIPTFLLWNWLMPVIFGVTQITLLQAWGINALSGCLIKSSTTINKK